MRDAPIRIMVVDDSSIVRKVVTRSISKYPNIFVVTTAENGKVALERLSQFDVDVVLLDIEMPVMDGIEALSKIMKEHPDVKVIMNSTRTKRNADITIKALSLGASDYIEKPSAGVMNAQDQFSLDLLRKVESLVHPSKDYYNVGRTSSVDKKVETSASTSSKGQITLLQDKPHFLLGALAIGSSTGGPQAVLEIFKILSKYRNKINVPIFITQHMPPLFTEYFAGHIAEASGMKCAEGKDGEIIEAGRIYVAPGDYHMLIKKDHAGRPHIKLTKDKEVNFCRPSVDVMFDSMIDVYNNRIIGIILTGMGSDGANSLSSIVKKGGIVIAQDQASSAVWGMPKAAADSGCCTKLLPPSGIANYIIDKIGGSQ